MEKEKVETNGQDIIVENSVGTEEQKKIIKEFIDQDKLVIITDF